MQSILPAESTVATEYGLYGHHISATSNLDDRGQDAMLESGESDQDVLVSTRCSWTQLPI